MAGTAGPAPSVSRPGRTITGVAVGFLVLDGALLTLTGMWLGRVGLVLWGVGFGAAAVAVVFYWRRYLGQLSALGAGLDDRFREVQELEADLGRSSGPYRVPSRCRFA